MLNSYLHQRDDALECPCDNHFTITVTSTVPCYKATAFSTKAPYFVIASHPRRALDTRPILTRQLRRWDESNSDLTIGLANWTAGTNMEWAWNNSLRYKSVHDVFPTAHDQFSLLHDGHELSAEPIWRMKGYHLRCSGHEGADYVTAIFFIDRGIAIDYTAMIETPYTNSQSLERRPDEAHATTTLAGTDVWYVSGSRTMPSLVHGLV